jgi:hypothetical protein
MKKKTIFSQNETFDGFKKGGPIHRTRLPRKKSETTSHFDPRLRTL